MAMQNIIPTIDLSRYLCSGAACDGCQEVASALERIGALLVRDPRIEGRDHDGFLDMMERYFDRSDTLKAQDVRAEQFYQVGLTPEFIERPRDHSAKAAQMPDGHRPTPPVGADAKSRFYWRIGERPERTEFPEMTPDNVEPEGFPEWRSVMDSFGQRMLGTAETVAEMLCLGFGAPRDAFTSKMRRAPHLLDPTGSDLEKHGAPGTVLAGFHYDLNFLSVHGRPRFPGLAIWTRNNERLPADVPYGHLLVQAGRQLEYLTGGRVHNGFHEVVVNDGTLQAIEAARLAGRPLWRVSSTFFAHIASDETLDPLPEIAPAGSARKFPKKLAGALVREELEMIRLAPQRQAAGYPS